MAKTATASKYIRVETPETTDGINLAYDENRQVKTAEAILPATAKAELLRNTAKLPEHLRPRISDYSAPAAKTRKPAATNTGADPNANAGDENQSEGTGKE